MKKLFTSLFMAMLSFMAMAQSNITGKILDLETNETLIGASIYLEGTSIGTTTDFDGSFTLRNVAAGTYNLIVSYTGYTDQFIKVTVESGPAVGNQVVNLGQIKMESGSVGLPEISVIASVAVDRRTPVAVTTIKGAEVEALVGNQEYPEILKKTPSIYVTKEGGGFGDSRINVRGFDQNNVAVMINGIPVNDMENGWVYWSNWAGLADVTSNLQIQRGLGATKLAVPSVGGSINIITNAAEMRKGGAASVSFGNDGYQKYGLVLSSGLGENGWAFTAQATHTRGDGYVDGTMFRAYSYFASISKTINANHTLAFTALGAPQWHHQRLTSSRFDNFTVGDLQEENLGRKFNYLWGDLNGEEFNWRRNFYHKPKAFLNHYWTISENTNLNTSAYVSLGRGGGTGPRGRLRTPGSVFDSFSGLGQGIHDARGQVRFNDLMAYNQGRAFEGWGQKMPASTGPFAGKFVNTSDGRFNGSGEEGTGFIRRASMNYHNWYGLLSTLNHQFTSNWNLVTGIDLRYYKGIHFRRLENLLGADAYLSRSDVNNPENYITDESPAEFGSFFDNSYKDGNNVLNYWNDGLVGWTGIFAQLEYTSNKLTAFASVNGSNQGFKRIDYFVYDDSDPNRESNWENKLGGYIKAGANYNIDDRSNIFFNTGFISKQPLFDNVYINFRNDVNEDVKNQRIYAFEAGYGFKARRFQTKVNAYYTEWGNRQFDQSIRNANGEDILYNFENVAQVHMGLEVELNWAPVNGLNIVGMLSLGNWEYKDDFTANGTNLDLNRPEGTLTIYGKDLKVGDAAQTTMNIGARYEIIDGLRLYADYYVADNLYANFDIQDESFQTSGASVIELPSYSLVDAGLSYNFDLGGLDLTFRFNMNNVFDKWYISELDTNFDDLMTNRGNVGFGRTWNTGIKVKF